MARHDAGPESKQLFRARVYYEMWHRYNGEWMKRDTYFGPYTKAAPAKSIITRETTMMEAQNMRARRSGENPPYRNIQTAIEATDLDWQPVP